VAAYQQLLASQGMIASMSRKANCYDNAHMESFWGTLKAEALSARSFTTRAEAELAIL
jgi:putative transposase